MQLEKNETQSLVTQQILVKPNEMYGRLRTWLQEVSAVFGIRFLSQLSSLQKNEV
jgi:hypothetical protein